MRRHLPGSAVDPLPPLRRRPPAPGTCGRWVPAAALLSSVRGAHSPAPAFTSQVSGLPPAKRRGQAGRARGPAPTGRTSPTQPRTQPLRMALTGFDCSSESASPRGSMALPDPRVRPLRHTAPPRKWTPAARLRRPGPPPARGSGRGRPGKRSARPSACGPGRLGGTAARRTRPREGGGGTGGGGRTTAQRDPDRTWCDDGVGAGG